MYEKSVLLFSLLLLPSSWSVGWDNGGSSQDSFPGNAPVVKPEEKFHELNLHYYHGMHYPPPPPPAPPPRPFDHHHMVQHAGLPRGLTVYTTPLLNSDHELCLNVSWLPPLRAPASDYSIEVQNQTPTVDCAMPLCYEYNIPGDARWWLIPAQASSVVGGCAVRPGCAYSVRLIAHPWDGHTAAHLNVELDECVEGVCSCAHAPRLPAPKVTAKTVSNQGELFVNISWTLPPPRYPLRLPPLLNKRAYYVSVGKQMVSDAHPSPWFAHTITRQVDTDGAVAAGDAARWLLLPVVERTGMRTIVLDVKLLARVSLLDDRGCQGPAGNATAYDPVEVRKLTITAYALWAILGGACMLAIVVVLAVGSRGVKRVLLAFRPAGAPAPLVPLRIRPAWLPLQLRPCKKTAPED